LKTYLIAFCVLCCLHSKAQQVIAASSGTQFQPLFNGRDLTGWYTFLPTKGINNDPELVFAVEQEMLHISGKEFGYLATNKVYENFNLVVEFKWGTKKWPPRHADTTKRDNGICFYLPADQKDTVWPKSIECQIQEGDVGDIWLIGGATVEVEGKRTQPMDYLRVQKKTDQENRTGEWNKVELVVNKGSITYLVNGAVVNTASNPNITKGKILIQSEGAEIYYRNIRLAEL